MSQVWTDIPSSQTIRDSRQILLDRFEALRSGFSGSAAPSDPATHQTFVNTTSSKVERWNGSAWVEEIDLGNAAGPTIANSTKLGGQAPSYYTDIPARLGYTPFNAAGGTIGGATMVSGSLSVAGSLTGSPASFVLHRSGDNLGGTFVGGGSAIGSGSGASISLYGISHVGNGGALILAAGDSETDGRLIFQTAGSQAGFFDRTQNLILNSTAIYRANGTGVLVVGGGNTSANGAYLTLFGPSHATAPNRAVVTAPGGLYCQAVYDTTTASAANVFVTSGGNLLRSTSAGKYKEVLGDFDPAIARKLLKLKKIFYRSKSKADRADWTWYGLLAEDVAALDPRFATFAMDAAGNPVLDENGKMVPEGVQYERFVVPLLVLADEAADRIKTLTDAVKTLRDQKDLLEARVAKLEKPAK